MDFTTYQKEAMSFRLPSANAQYALFNLTGEVGELNSLIAKGIRDGAQKDFRECAEKELGDILWSLTAVCDDLGLSLEQVASTNIGKLADRKKRNVIQGSGDNR